MIDSQIYRTEWPHAPGLWDDKHVEGWKNIVDAVHEAGTKIYAQLWHGVYFILITWIRYLTLDLYVVGRAAHPDMPEQKLAGTPVYAPSAIAARGGKFRILPGAPGYVTVSSMIH